jgi:hypothetical protein
MHTNPGKLTTHEEPNDLAASLNAVWMTISKKARRADDKTYIPNSNWKKKSSE